MYIELKKNTSKNLYSVSIDMNEKPKLKINTTKSLKAIQLKRI